MRPLQDPDPGKQSAAPAIEPLVRGPPPDPWRKLPRPAPIPGLCGNFPPRPHRQIHQRPPGNRPISSPTPPDPLRLRLELPEFRLELLEFRLELLEFRLELLEFRLELLEFRLELLEFRLELLEFRLELLEFRLELLEFRLELPEFRLELLEFRLELLEFRLELLEFKSLFPFRSREIRENREFSGKIRKN